MNATYLILSTLSTLAGVLLGAWVSHRARIGKSPLPEVKQKKNDDPKKANSFGPLRVRP